MTYNAETRQAIAILKNKIDVDAVTEIWESALATNWKGKHVWVHGDIGVCNLLVKNGRLCAIFDFGQLTIGDRACDLAITWTLFNGESREIFRKILQLDADTWARARA